MNPILPIVAVSAVGVLAFSKPAGQTAQAVEYIAPVREVINTPLDYVAQEWTDTSPINYDLMDQPMIVNYNSQSVDNTASNLLSFMKIIRVGESSDNYQALAGGGNFESFDDHPALITNWPGIRVSKGLRSYAAGAYQITRDTWRSLNGKLRYGNFSPASQDQACIDLLHRRGAYELVISGRAVEAANKLRSEWQIFTLDRWNSDIVAQTFTNYGGILA